VAGFFILAREQMAQLDQLSPCQNTKYRHIFFFLCVLCGLSEAGVKNLFVLRNLDASALRSITGVQKTGIVAPLSL